MLSTGPHGTLIALSSPNASHLVFVSVHSSISAKISSSRDSRASGVA